MFFLSALAWFSSCPVMFLTLVLLLVSSQNRKHHRRLTEAEASKRLQKFFKSIITEKRRVNNGLRDQLFTRWGIQRIFLLYSESAPLEYEETPYDGRETKNLVQSSAQALQAERRADAAEGKVESVADRGQQLIMALWKRVLSDEPLKDEVEAQRVPLDGQLLQGEFVERQLLGF